jgi:methanogenic corrinoid protein MtbC1
MENPQLSAAQLGITSAAIAGDTGSLYRIAAALLDEGVPFETVLFEALLLAEHDVGVRWQAGDYLVSEEHAATASLETVISLLAGSLDQPREGLQVVVATAQGDNHSLPARAVAAHLLFLGYRTTFLGANVLASDLRDFLESDPPDAVVLSCAMTVHLLGARDAVRECHAIDVPVLVGGKAFGAEGMWAPDVGADAWVLEAKDVGGLLESWAPDPRRAEAKAKNPDETLRRVIDQRNAVLADAESRLRHSVGEANGARWREELFMTLKAAEASMLVEDTSLLSEFLEWQALTLDAHGLTGHTEAVASLSQGLQAVVPEVGDWIDQALAR